jgi:hypothetical protein
MNKAKIIAELENMVAARLFSGQPWLADRETNSAYHRKHIQMGLLEQVRDKPQTWRNTRLGNELAVDEQSNLPTFNAVLPIIRI